MIDFAIENDVFALAITDHDTIDGLQEAIGYAEKKGVKLITGIEFSIDYKSGSFHLLGLNIDSNHRGLQEEAKSLTEYRENRIYRMIEDLKKHGIDIPVEDVQKQTNDGSIGRPHMARAMVQHGYASNVKEIFQSYLVRGKPGYVEKERIPFNRAISLINDSGGVPVIAHPISLGFSDFNEFEVMLKEFMKEGLKGIEVYSYMHSSEQIDKFNHLAKKYGLLVTGGSDFHGDKEETIGHYSSKNKIPEEIYSNIKEYLNNRDI